MLYCIHCYVVRSALYYWHFFNSMLWESSFQIETVDKNSENQFSSMDFECQVISGTRTFSEAWWDDIGK